MSEPTLFHVFTPQRDQPEELEKILVKRHALLESAVGKIRASVLSPDKHRLLLIGPRGMGKSYLTTLIHHRLSRQDDLSEKMRFAWLNEDQTSTTFLHLLIRIYRKLADQYPSEFAASELDAIRGKDPADAREILGQALIRQLDDRTVVLIIENLDSIFGAMNEIEQRTWRGFLQDHPRFALVATAQGLTSDISSKTKPFYGFFDIRHLDPLSVDEAAELLEKIAALNGDQPLAEFIASSRGKARMRAIHHLSGGNPRLYLILSDFLTKDSLDNLVRLFEETVDRQLTPYFQERMRWLSPQQQEIVQYLCQETHPASVKAIAEGIFTKQNTVSSQLKQLREKGYLVSKSRGKESLYELAEPLMRLSFQVKEMNSRQPLTLIVDFMRVWYDRTDLEKRLEGILPGTFGRDYFEVALQKISTEGNTLRHSLMLACLDDFDLNKCDDQELDELRGIAEETNDFDAWFKYGHACFNANRHTENVFAMSQIINLLESKNQIFFLALFSRANSLQCLNQRDEAIDDYSAVIGSSEILEEILHCSYLLRGNIYRINGNLSNAVADFSQIPKSQKYATTALLELSRAYYEMRQFELSMGSLYLLLNHPKFHDDWKKHSITLLHEILVDAAYGLKDFPEKWMSAMSKILPLLSNEYCSELLTSLIRHLTIIEQSDLNHAALDRWVSDWERVSEGYPEMQIGIRMLRAGVEWIKTKNDGALLDLVMEERAIVRQALGLEEEE